MKKRKMTIEEYKNSLGAHTIIINNARYQRDFIDIIQKLIREFMVEEELFFGFYRTDGINLTLKQQEEQKNKIPELFQKYGELQTINEYLTVARLEKRNYNRGMILPIFDYYLETILFNPKVDWKTFKQYYSDYQNHRVEDIIINQFAEILFFYFDSGDFLICFNPAIYNPGRIRSLLTTVFSGE